MRANLRTLCFWCLGILAMVGGGMGKYSGFDASGQNVADLVGKMPKVLLAVFGMNGVDLSTAAGFYAVVYALLLIMASLYAALLGAGIISKEERDKTSEFLFVKPVSRSGIISSKILAALTNLVLFNSVSLLVSVGVALKVAPNEDLNDYLAVLSLAMLIIQLMFFFMGTAFASFSKRSALSAGRVSIIVLITYLFSIMIDINENMDFLRFLTPFKYFEAKTLMNGGSMEPQFLLISLFVAGLGLTLTYVFFPKRDIGI